MRACGPLLARGQRQSAPFTVFLSSAIAVGEGPGGGWEICVWLQSPGGIPGGLSMNGRVVSDRWTGRKEPHSEGPRRSRQRKAME